MSELYERFSPLVRVAAFDHTGDLNAAWDIVQDVFVIVMRDLRRLRQPEKFQNWLTGIARRKAIDFIRGRVRRRKLIVPLNEKEDRIPRVSGPDAVLSSLREAVSGLPEKERLAVQLFHLEELPVREVIEILDMPRSTVYSVLIRARKRLRKQLDEEEIRKVMP